jgi:signal transduction histidine kinase
VALAAQLSLWRFMSASPFLFFFAAVMVASWWGGWGPGLAATLLSMLAVDYFFLAPLHTLGMGPGDALSLLIFVLLSLGMTRLNVALRRTSTEHAAALVRERRARKAAEVAEERYRTFVSQSTEGIFRMEAEPPILVDLPEDAQLDAMYASGFIAECNDAMARMYGLEEAASLQGVRLEQLLIRGDPRNTEYLRAFIRSRYRLADAESHEVDLQGRRRVFLNNLVGIVKEGRLVGAWGTQREVTEQRGAEEALRFSAADNARLAREAQEAIRVRDEFLSVASHELKTPLTPLSLRLQMLAAETARQPDSPYVQKVRDSVELGRRQVAKLSTLIGDLLDVSRIVAGRLRLEWEEGDMAAIVREVISRYEAQATRAGSPLSLEAPSTLPGRWDVMRLEQVVTNLVDNAIKYGAGRPIHLRLTAEGSHATLAVRDEGIGIAPEHLSRIFERFARAVSERNYGGLGLGLYISRTLVEAMGGEIRVQSTPGQGATFTVRLPVHTSTPERE